MALFMLTQSARTREHRARIAHCVRSAVCWNAHSAALGFGRRGRVTGTIHMQLSAHADGRIWGVVKVQSVPFGV